MKDEPDYTLPLDYEPAAGRVSVFAKYAILTFGVFCAATSVIMIKNTACHPIWLSACRVLLAASLLTPAMFYCSRKHAQPIDRRQILRSLPGAIMLGLHFIAWTTGARLTGTANSSLIVNLAPVVMPFLMFYVNGERIRRDEILGTLVTVAGCGLLLWEDWGVGRTNFRGDIICVIGMLLACGYLTLGRRLGAGTHIWVYIVPLYWMAGLFDLGIALCLRIPPPPFTLWEWSNLLGLALLPTIVGHTTMNWAIKHMRGQIVSTANLGQFIFAAVMAFFLLGEVPTTLFYVAAAVLAIGVIIVAGASNRAEIPEE